MIIYENTIEHMSMPFEDYLKLDGYSHSFLKQQRNGVAEEINVTQMMKLGKIVDAILTEPSVADMTDPQYNTAKIFAHEITSVFGSVISQAEKQVSFVSMARFLDFVMPTKGRLDFLIRKHAVIDLKITKLSDVNALIEFFGYKNQLWHYCKMAKVDHGYLIIYSIPLKRVIPVYVNCSDGHNPFWAEHITSFGKIAA